MWSLWKHLNLPDPTLLQYDIALYLALGPRRRMVMGFRGVAKSWLTAAYVVWRLWKNHQLKVMIVSANKERADAASIFIKQIIETVPELAFLRARGDQRYSNVAFDVGPATPDPAPSVKSVGITGQLTGGRADIIIADDIEVPKNSMTVVQREKLAELIKEFDAVLKPDGEIIYLGTPQTEESIYNQLPARGYEIRIWPARFPKDAKHRAQYGDKLAPYIADKFDADPKLAWKPTDPDRFDERDLMEREASYGRSGFMLQFMLDTTLSDAERYPLKLSDLIVMDVDRELAPVRLVWSSGPDYVLNDIHSVGFTGDRLHRPMHASADMAEYTGKIMTIDPSGGGANGDETGYAVTFILGGFIFVRRCGGLRGGYDMATLESLAHIARAEKVQTVVIEENYGNGMFAALFAPVLERIYPCPVEQVRHHGQKERRIIQTMEPVLNQHRVVMDRAVLLADQKTEESQYQLFYQLTRLTNERGALRHDDRVEALSMGIAYWADQLSRDVDKDEEAMKERWYDEQLRQFEEYVLGHSSSISDNYLDVF